MSLPDIPDIKDVRSLSDEAIDKEILDCKKKLFDLRFQQATGRLDKSHEFKHTRHRLAQLLTIQTERDCI
jgi:large subunit ribosomal protein L29